MSAAHGWQQVPLSRRGLLAAAIGAGLAVAGCSSSESDELVFWKAPFLAPDRENAYFKGLIDEFGKDHQGLAVKHVVIPWESAATKFTAAFAGSNPPDVSYLNLPSLNKFHGAKAVAALEDIGDDVAKYMEGVNENIVKAVKGEDGKHYALPYVSGHNVMSLNPKIWEKAGKPPKPKTYDDLITFAKQLTFDTKGRQLGQPGFDANNIATYGFGWPGLGQIETNWIWNYFWAYGCDYLNEAGTDIGFNNDEGRATLQHMKNMVTSGACTPLNLYGDEIQGWADSLYNDKVAMGWTDAIRDVNLKAFPQARLEVLDMPAGPAGQFVVGAAGYLAVAAKSKKKEQAYQFATFLRDPDRFKPYSRECFVYPVSGVTPGYYDGAGDPRIVKFVTDAVAQMKYTRLTRVMPYEPQDFLIGELNDFLLGRKTMEQMITDSSRQVKLMARNAGL